MRVRLPVLWCSVAMMATAVPVLADSFTVVRVTRSITVQAVADTDSRSAAVSGQSHLDETRTATSGDEFASAGASLDTSRMTSSKFIATGNTFVKRGTVEAEAGGMAESYFRVEFTVNEPLRFRFDAKPAASGKGSSWLAVLRSGDRNVFRYNSGNAKAGVADGLLDPGKYEFLARAESVVFPQSGTGESGARFELGLGLEAAPPATPRRASLLLVGAGAAGLSVLRRRKRSS